MKIMQPVLDHEYFPSIFNKNFHWSKALCLANLFLYIKFLELSVENDQNSKKYYFDGFNRSFSKERSILQSGGNFFHRTEIAFMLDFPRSW